MKNLDIVFPFYDTMNEQYRYRDGVDNIPALNVSDESLVPWVIRRVHNSGTINDIELYFYPTDETSAFNVHGADANISISVGTTYDYIYFTGPLPAALPHLACGYYLKVLDKGVAKSWYSETFFVRTATQLANFILIEFSNDTDLGTIPGKWTQKFYIDQEFRITEYLREDTGEKRNGILVPEKMVKITDDILFINQAPKYLIDALIMLPFFDTVTLTDKFTDQYTFDEIRTKDPEWILESFGQLAKFEIHLLSGVYIKKLNFKYLGGSTVATNTIIKQSPVPVLTVKNGKYYEYYVLFDEKMPDIYYTADAVAISTGENNSRQFSECTNMTIHGFLIRTPVQCEVRWTAIRVTP